MPRHTDKPVEEIVTDPEAIPEEPEELGEAIPAPEDYETEFSARASDFVDIDALDSAPTFQQAHDEAHIPPHIPMKDLVDKTIFFVHKRKQKAMVPPKQGEEGKQPELRDGYFCLCVDADTKQEFTTWVGQVILYRNLTLLRMPFKTTIVKRGRTFMFQ